MAYLLDSDVFIQAKNRHYGFDFCPAFWDWIVAKNKQGTLFSISRVANELIDGNDQLADWASTRDPGFFLEPDPVTLPALSTVSEWAMNQGFTPAAINSFFQAADFYLIAQALAHRHIVVTHEVPANTVQRIKIPNVCIGLGIQHLNPFEMLRVERARFILG
jgi:hypothetical protein